MAKESPFLKKCLAVFAKHIPPNFTVLSKKSLLYEIAVDNNLNVVVDPQNPVRGQSAFETDICIFEHNNQNIKIPRIVFEFKPGISTHDVIIYSAKARRHKLIYPYLRYGLIIEREEFIPKRFFLHDDSFDFCLACARYSENRLESLFKELIESEIAQSKSLENIYYANTQTSLYQVKQEFTTPTI